MASTVKRRPLPALVSLLALLLLAGLVWWRVLHRGGTTQAATHCPTPTVAAPTLTLPAPTSITVQVLNATTRHGIAAGARKTLLAEGFNVPALAANASPKDHVLGTAQIRYGPRGKQGATMLRYYFPGASLRPTTTHSATVTVSLGAKYRRVASPYAVRTALRGDNVAVATPTPSPSPTAGASTTPSC